MIRWLAYGLLSVSFGAAVVLNGGKYPQQWEWSALGISLAASVWVLSGPKRERSPGKPWGLALMAAVLVWVLLQLVPLPPALLGWLSPMRWDAVAAAREATGQAMGDWAALSLAPAATLQRLLDVIPAMAAFVAAREMGWWWQDRMWIAVAPVIGVAWLESLLGLVQFYSMRMTGAGLVAGTYPNRDHFAGLVEMAFPLALMWAIATWRKGASRLQERPVGSALATVALLGIASCLLMGVILSLSRMGFISTLIAASLTMLMLLLSLGSAASRWVRGFRWVLPLALPLFILLFLPTRELLLRFADMAATEDVTKDTRMEIWQNTAQSLSAYRWTGAGLGAYERGLYRYKTVAPTNTVDFVHNDYLQILAELGIIGAALVAALGLWILWRLLSVVLRGRYSGNWALAVGLLAALLAFAIHSLADFNLYVPANALALAWLSGVAVSPGLRSN